MSYQGSSEDELDILQAEGAEHTEDIDTYDYDEDGKVTVIKGFPPCPICFEILSLRGMPDVGESRWYCKSCGTQWDTPDLIKAMNMEE